MVGTHQLDDQYLAAIEQLLDPCLSKKMFRQRLVDAPFNDIYQSTLLDLGMIVLVCVDKTESFIKRVAISNTSFARGGLSISEKPFREIRTPLNNKVNLISKSINSNKPIETGDWYYLFTPDFTRAQSRIIQQAAGIKTSVIHPLKTSRKSALIFSFYQAEQHTGARHQEFMTNYAYLVEKAVDSRNIWD